LIQFNMEKVSNVNSDQVNFSHKKDRLLSCVFSIAHTKIPLFSVVQNLSPCFPFFLCFVLPFFPS
jgi:hypothetical protein